MCKLFLACGHLHNIARHRLIQPPTSFEMGSDESSQDETGSESEDTGSPSQAIQDDIQAQNIVIRWQDQGEIPTPRKEIWLCPSPGSWLPQAGWSKL